MRRLWAGWGLLGLVSLLVLLDSFYRFPKVAPDGEVGVRVVYSVIRTLVFVGSAAVLVAGTRLLDRWIRKERS